MGGLASHLAGEAGNKEDSVSGWLCGGILVPNMHGAIVTAGEGELF